MIRDNREYRDMALQIRKAEEKKDNEYIVEGYASTFEDYLLYSWGEEEFWERIEPTAFKETDMSDVVFNIDHSGRVYARTRNKALELSVDDHGLKMKADLSKSEAARGLYEDIECGNYDRMSFAFRVEEDEYVRNSSKKVTRVIKKVSKLFDVSAVSFPANPGTDIGVSARSLYDGFIEKEQLELAENEKRHQLELAKARFAFATVGKD